MPGRGGGSDGQVRLMVAGGQVGVAGGRELVESGPGVGMASDDPSDPVHGQRWGASQATVAAFRRDRSTD